MQLLDWKLLKVLSLALVPLSFPPRRRNSCFGSIKIRNRVSIVALHVAATTERQSVVESTAGTAGLDTFLPATKVYRGRRANPQGAVH